MNLIDTNAVQHVQEGGKNLDGVYYLAPDIEEEVAITRILMRGARLPNFLSIKSLPSFDEVAYINNYNIALNKYTGRSFFNMTGFGDISILASLMALCETPTGKQVSLFDEPEEIVVFTDDISLIKKIRSDFTDKNVRVANFSDIY
jgi:hypothetical protein